MSANITPNSRINKYTYGKYTPPYILAPLNADHPLHPITHLTKPSEGNLAAKAFLTIQQLFQNVTNKGIYQDHLVGREIYSKHGKHGQYETFKSRNEMLTNVLLPRIGSLHSEDSTYTGLFFGDFDFSEKIEENQNLSIAKLQNDPTCIMAARTPKGVWSVHIVYDYTNDQKPYLQQYFKDIGLELDLKAARPKQTRYPYYDPKAFLKQPTKALLLHEYVKPKPTKPKREAYTSTGDISRSEVVYIAARKIREDLERDKGTFGENNRNDLAYWFGFRFKGFGFSENETLDGAEMEFGLSQWSHHINTLLRGWKNGTFYQDFDPNPYLPKERREKKPGVKKVRGTNPYPAPAPARTAKPEPTKEFLPLKRGKKQGSFEQYFGKSEYFKDFLGKAFGRKLSVLDLPTRSGKSTLTAANEFSEYGILEEAEKRYSENLTFLVVSPRLTLVQSEFNRYEKRGFVNISSEGKSQTKFNPEFDTRVMTTTKSAVKVIQKCIKHGRNVVVLFDEIHTLFTDTYQNVGELSYLFRNEKVKHVIGLTATPLVKPFEWFGYEVFSYDRKVNPQTNIRIHFAENQKELDALVLEHGQRFSEKRTLLFCNSVDDTKRYAEIIGKQKEKVWYHNAKVSNDYKAKNEALNGIIQNEALPKQTTLVCNKTAEVGLNVKNCDSIAYVAENARSFLYDPINFIQSYSRNRSKTVNVDIFLLLPSEKTLAKREKAKQDAARLLDFSFEAIKASSEYKRAKSLVNVLNKQYKALEEGLEESEGLTKMEVQKLKEKQSQIGTFALPKREKDYIRFSKERGQFYIYKEKFVNDQYKEICSGLLPSEFLEHIQQLLPYAKIQVVNSSISKESLAKSEAVSIEYKAEKEKAVDALKTSLLVFFELIVKMFFQLCDDTEIKEKISNSLRFRELADFEGGAFMFRDANESDFFERWKPLVSKWFSALTPYILRICDLSNLSHGRLTDAELVTVAFMKNAAYGKIKAQIQTAMYRSLIAKYSKAERKAILGAKNFVKLEYKYNQDLQIVEFCKAITDRKQVSAKYLVTAVNNKFGKGTFSNARSLSSFLNQYTHTEKGRDSFKVGEFLTFEDVKKEIKAETVRTQTELDSLAKKEVNKIHLQTDKYTENQQITYLKNLKITPEKEVVANSDFCPF